MKWLGKVAGGALGLALTASPIGLVIGAALGHRFDQGLQQGQRRDRLRGSRGYAHQHRHSHSDDLFFKVTFRLMGHLAKIDGRVSEESVKSARSLMHQMELSPEQVKFAIEYFNQGKSPEFSLHSLLPKLISACRSRKDLIRSFLELQVQVILGAGNITSNQRSALWRVCQSLNVSRVELAQIEALMRIRLSNANYRQENRPQSETPLQLAYQTLGVEADASDDEIKQRYRRLMNAHHPDKLHAQGADEDVIKESTDKVQVIRAAYDAIKASRSIK
ncbi:MAG: co-chaperone DjlA [Pseudomonadota bacterium]